MRTFLAFLLIVALLAGGIALFLTLTTPSHSAGVHFPVTADQRALLLRVPASADAFALIPTAGALEKALLANPVTRDPLEQWTETQPLPGPWLLGSADVVAWRSGKDTSYAVQVDAFRAFIVRTWLMWNGGVDARWDGRAFVINGKGGAPMPAQSLDAMLALAASLPPGDLLAVQVNRSRGAFPPIGRPAVSSVKVTPSEIVIVSRSHAPTASDANDATPHGATAASAVESPVPHPPSAPRKASFPRGAMLAVTFTDPPRLIGDLQRFVGIDVETLVSDGGSLILYDVDAGTLLPRPKGLVAVPADDRRREAMTKVATVAELVGQTRDTGKELLASFDRNSMDLYLKDASVPATWPSTSWAARIDPGKLVPVLERLGDSTGLRLASGRLHRAVRDLRRWISALEKAESIEAAASEANGTEELRVRIATK